MKDKTLAIREDGYELSAPKQMLSMAAVLKDYVVKEKLYTTIASKNYAHVEGWQFAGGLMGMFPRVVSVENLSSGNEIKWRADVEIVRLKDGEVVSRGIAVCSNKENKKKSFDEYAILSMAQTRAIGKAYRNVAGWVMKLAGYDATPAEEMGPVGQPSATPTKETIVVPEDAGYECHEGGEIITKQEHDYSKKIYGKPLCREHQKGATRLKK